MVSWVPPWASNECLFALCVCVCVLCCVAVLVALRFRLCVELGFISTCQTWWLPAMVDKLATIDINMPDMAVTKHGIYVLNNLATV